MAFSEKVYQVVCGFSLFPLSNSLMNRTGILKRYNSAMKTQKAPQDVLRDIQVEKLRQVIRYANAYVPFYRKRFADIGLHPEDIKELQDVASIPPLTRQDIIDHHRQLVDERHTASIEFAEKSTKGPGEPIQFARFRRHKLIKNTSSGSTGAPTIFYEDGSISASNWANELRLRKWYGVDPGAKEARLVRIAVDYMPNSRSMMMRKILWNQLMLPGVNLSDREYELNYRKLAEFQPQVIWGFTSSLAGLAEYMQRRELAFSGWKPKVCITWAAPLYDHEKESIKQVFQCPVTNIYGAREVGHIAAVCPEGSLHINQETLYVETEPNPQEYPGINGGELLVTTLERTPMPFIRYRMGDIGETGESDCSCGKTLQVLKNFQGRTGEIFITRDGRMISPNFWCRTFMNKKIAGTVKRFQVIYTKHGAIDIKIVKNETFTRETQEVLMNFLKENFHQDIGIAFHYVDTIQPHVSGKYLMVSREH